MDRDVEVEGEGNLRELEATGFLNWGADPSGITLVDARNGFNEMSRLEILQTVWHRWLAGAMFVFNFYRHWLQLLLFQTG